MAFQLDFKGDMVKHELRVESLKVRVGSLKAL